MKLAFVDVRYKTPVTLPQAFLDRLPLSVALFLNIQFHYQYDAIKAQIEASGRQVLTHRPKHAWHEGQVLGCSVEHWDGQDAFVYVGDGLFHPKALLFSNQQDVHTYDPKTGEIGLLTQQELSQIQIARKVGLSTFYASERIGVLITSKYGQARLRDALQLKERFPDKTFYYLVADVIDFAKLEDFPFIQCYINTACPRIMDDNEKLPRPVLNISELGVVW